MNRISRVTLLCVGLMLVFRAFSANEPPSLLSGNPFSDPTYRVSMPEEWQQRPIVYDRWANGADLALTLDKQIYYALLPLIEQFSKEKGVKIATQEGTCGVSAANIIDKQIDIGGFCCPAGNGDRLPGLQFHTLAIAPLAIMVHPENPINNLSLNELQAIFQGNIKRWNGVSQATNFKLRIRPIVRLHCKSRPGHWKSILADERMFAPRVHHVSTINEIVKAVGNIKNGIGYETMWMIKNNMGKVKSLNINGFSPYDDALLSGNYPLYRVYNMTSWNHGSTKNLLAEELVAYIHLNFEKIPSEFNFISSSKLRSAGWKFIGSELLEKPTL